MYTYIYTHTYIHTYIVVYLEAAAGVLNSSKVCVCVSIYVCTYIYIYMCVCVCVCVRACLCVCLHIYSGIPDSCCRRSQHSSNVCVCVSWYTWQLLQAFYIHRKCAYSPLQQRLLRQFLCVCTSKASKLITFCTSKASKLSKFIERVHILFQSITFWVSLCNFVLVQQVNW